MIVKLKGSEQFIPITEGNHRFYGGNQAWFSWKDRKNKTLAAQKGGCGTVASANITAYLAQNSSQYASLYAYQDYTKNSYLLHMKEMYEYVSPYQIGSTPLGVWPIGRLADGVERFARDRGVNLYAVWQDKTFNRENVIQYIGEGLKRDLPVAMLVGMNPLKQVTTIYDGGESSREDMRLHWVTITELQIHGDQARVKVSTWGGFAELDLDEYMKERVYGGVLYFDGT